MSELAASSQRPQRIRRAILLGAILAGWVCVMGSPMCLGPRSEPEFPESPRDLSVPDDCMPCSRCAPALCVNQSGRLCCLRNS